MNKTSPIARYLDNVPPARRPALSTLRSLILDSAPEAEETMRYNMPTYDVGEHIVAAFASQKHYMSLYMNTDVVAAHKDELAHLNCGKSCIRFKSLDELPLDTVQTMLQESYEKAQSPE